MFEMDGNSSITWSTERKAVCFLTKTAVWISAIFCDSHTTGLNDCSIGWIIDKFSFSAILLLCFEVAACFR